MKIAVLTFDGFNALLASMTVQQVYTIRGSLIARMDIA